ncbi:unnamed protein product, partial [Scytosiphon promiscuus]
HTLHTPSQLLPASAIIASVALVLACQRYGGSTSLWSVHHSARHQTRPFLTLKRKSMEDFGIKSQHYRRLPKILRSCCTMIEAEWLRTAHTACGANAERWSKRFTNN